MTQPGQRLYPDFSSKAKGWDTRPARYFLKERSVSIGKDWDKTQLLSLTKKGVIDRDIDSGVGKYPASFEGYQLVEPGNLVFCLFDVEETPRTIGLVKNGGMITAAYTAYQVNENLANPRFLEYLFVNVDNSKRYRPFYSGLRNTIPKGALLGTMFSLPPIEEQKAIADFLDRELAQIDHLVSRQDSFMALLAERSQTLVRNTILEGLEPERPAKKTLLPWVSSIPFSWAAKPLWMVLKFDSGWTPPSGKDEYFEGEYLWANISDLGPRILTTTQKCISDLAVNEFRLRSVKPGTLLFSFKLSIGQVSIAGVPMYTNEAIAAFGPNDFLDIDYMYFMLPIAIPHNATENIYGAKMLNAQRIKQARVLIPPKDEQVRIASFLQKQMTEMEAIVQKATETKGVLLEKRQALINAAVTGKIDVRGKS